MSGHHPFSPSHYNPWAHCIHWESDSNTSDEAKAGTEHHHEMEMGIIDHNYEPNSVVARWAVERIRNLASDADVTPECSVIGSVGIFDGISGTIDALWVSADGIINVADLKSFSDGSKNYTYQLMGYVCLYATKDTPPDTMVHLHILNGGTFTTNTIITTVGECMSSVSKLLERVKDGSDTPAINDYCQYCKHKGKCNAMNTAIATVSNDTSLAFSDLPLARKLVVCDTIEKIIKAVKDEAWKEAMDNGGVIEDDGIRYEIKTKAGRGKVRSLVDVNTALVSDSLKFNGIDADKLLSLCELPKTAFVDAMKKANADRKDVKKKDIEEWCSSFYEKGEPISYLSRVS